jgi:hypothetical protein
MLAAVYMRAGTGACWLGESKGITPMTAKTLISHLMHPGGDSVPADPSTASHFYGIWSSLKNN